MTGIKIPDHTRIDTLSGDFKIVQPCQGQRYTTDDMLVAWLSIRQIKHNGIENACFLDLGSGLCSIPLIMLQSLPLIEGIGVEKDPDRFRLGKFSVKLNRVGHRFNLINGDLRDLHLKKTFPVVTSSPPYHSVDEGVISPKTQRAIVRFELNGGIIDYFNAADKHLSQAGLFITVYPFRQEKRVLKAAQDTGFFMDTRVDVIPIESKPPLMSLYVFLKGKEGKNTCHTLMIRNRDRMFTQAYKQLRKEIGFPEPKE